MSKPPYVGLDLGLRQVGVALSESGLLAQPLETIGWQPPHTHQLMQSLVSLCAKHQVATVVAGIPLGEDDEVTGQAVKTGQLLDDLSAALAAAGLAVEIVRVNEFHSTQDAIARFPGVDKDAAAAAVILQDYLEQQGVAW